MWPKILIFICLCWGVFGEQTELVLNGKLSRFSQFPSMASLEDQLNGRNQHFCGGSIINEQWILTAGHCVDSSLIDGVFVVSVGSPDNQARFLNQRIPVAKAYRHPCYDDATTQFDIGLLKLEKNITFNTHTKAVALPTADWDVEMVKYGQIAGWGAITPNQMITSRYLLYADVEAINPQTCNQTYGSANFDSKMICVDESRNNDASACAGDSGGPFFQTSDNDPVVVGLTSYGPSQCGTAPVVFTRVQSYLDYISAILAGQDYVCTPE